MNIFKTGITSLLIAFTGIFSLTSCDDDWLEDGFPQGGGSIIIPQDVYGPWRIVEIRGSSKYETGDEWYFRRNGQFESHGYGGLNEYGNWERIGNRIHIYFNSVEPEIIGHIRNFEGDYMVLDVNDLTYGENYRMKMIKEINYINKQK